MMNFLKVFIGTTLLVLSTGCWDRTEINDVAIIVGTSFDKVGENEYRVGIQAPLPSGLGGTGSQGGGGTSSDTAPFYIDSGMGRNVREANADLQVRMPRKMMFGHRRVVLMGEKLAQSGLGQVVDVLIRTRETRLATQMFVTKGEAIEVLSAVPHLETLTAEAIRELGVQRFGKISVQDFLLKQQQVGNDPILAVVETVENEVPIKEHQSDQVELRSVAIFKDDKLEFITNEEQTAGVRWLEELKEGETMTVSMGDKGEISFRIQEQMTSIGHEIVAEQPVFTIDVEFIASVLENETDLNLEEKKVFDDIEGVLQQEVTTQIEAILDESLKRGIDSFGLGWRVSRKEKQKWPKWQEDWREMLPSLEVNVNVDSKIELPGLVTEGIGIRSDE